LHWGLRTRSCVRAAAISACVRLYSQHRGLRELVQRPPPSLEEGTTVYLQMLAPRDK
jgi:hypothetical protein